MIIKLTQKETPMNISDIMPKDHQEGLLEIAKEKEQNAIDALALLTEDGDPTARKFLQAALAEIQITRKQLELLFK